MYQILTHPGVLGGRNSGKSYYPYKTNENYYGGASVWNFMRRVYDDITGNTTYEAEPLPLGGTMDVPDNSITD